MSQFFLPNVDSVALFSESMTLLKVEGKKAESFLSPIHAARFVAQYLPLQSGDWVALNDGLGGSTCPFGINLIGRYQSIIWSVRLTNVGLWKDSEKWDSMGFRLPPLPLKMQGKMNSQVPAKFLNIVQPFCDRVAPSISKLEKYIDWNQKDFSKKNFELYLEKTEKKLRELLKDNPWLDQTAKARTSSGEIISLNISFTDQAAIVDLSGTSPSKKIELNEKITDSIIVYGFLMALKNFELYNGANEKFFQVIKPTQCWLNSKEPKLPMHSHFISAPFLMSHMKQLLLKLKLPVEGWNCSLDGFTQFEAADGSHWTNNQILQNTWGKGSPLFNAHKAAPGGIELLTQVDLSYMRVQAGSIEVGQLEKGNTWSLQL
ncbi:MAG: hypothetical protein ACK5W9_10750 [Bdellovibrionales bacterium]